MIRFRHFNWIVVTCWVSISIFVGSSTQSSAQSGAGNWRAKIGTFRIGVVGTGAKEYDLARLMSFKQAFRKTLGMPVEIMFMEDFNALIEAQMESRIEYAVYSASAFATIWAKCNCVQPLVAPITADGARGFRSVLLAKKEEATSLTELKGKTVLLPGRHSFAGYLFPRDQFAKQGIDIEKTEWKIASRGSMETAVADLLQGQGAAMFGWELYYKADPATEHDGQGTRKLLGNAKTNYVSVWQSQPVLFGPHAVRADLDERAKVLLWDMLVNLDRSDPSAYDAISPNQGGGFRRVTRGDYQPVIHFVRQNLNIDHELLPNQLATK